MEVSFFIDLKTRHKLKGVVDFLLVFQSTFDGVLIFVCVSVDMQGMNQYIQIT